MSIKVVYPLGSGGLNSNGTATIPQFENADPSSLIGEQAWVKHTNPTVAGEPIGLLLALTHAATVTEKWEFSYYTNQGSIKRVQLV
jgi:hypothetical protein